MSATYNWPTFAATHPTIDCQATFGHNGPQAVKACTVGQYVGASFDPNWFNGHPDACMKAAANMGLPTSSIATLAFADACGGAQGDIQNGSFWLYLQK